MNLIRLIGVAFTTLITSIGGAATSQTNNQFIKPKHNDAVLYGNTFNIEVTSSDYLKTYSVSNSLTTTLPGASYIYGINYYYYDVGAESFYSGNVGTSTDGSDIYFDTAIEHICSSSSNYGGLGAVELFHRYGNDFTLYRIYFTYGLEFRSDLQTDFNVTSSICPYFLAYSSGSPVPCTYDFVGDGFGTFQDIYFYSLQDVFADSSQSFLDNSPYQFLSNRSYSPMDFSGDLIVDRLGLNDYGFTFYPLADYISSASYSVSFTFKFTPFDPQMYDGTNYYNGYNAGYDDGYSAGESDGRSSGYQTGYADGYQEADNTDSVALTIFTGIIDVGLLPINFFLACLNFEVFGINIGGLVTSLLTVAIVIIIIRIITGGKKEE